MFPLIYIPVSVATFVVFILRYLRRPNKCFPPGPKGRFLVGNLSDIPNGNAGNAETHIEWRKHYGSVMHMEAFGKHTIILNTVEAANDLMDKRAAIYSHRPRMPMLVELVGSDWVLGTISGELHKEQRSLAQRYFFSQSKDWQHIQLESSRALLKNLLANPDDWMAHVRLSAASSVIQICYGHKATHTDDSILKVIRDTIEVPRNGPYLVDFLPLLKYYPSWLPGGRFKTDAAEARLLTEQFRYTAFNMVRRQMAAGTASPSFVSTLLSQLPPEEDLELSHQAKLIRDTAASMYGAAVDSTVSFMYTFLGAMVLRPDIQHQAQHELDSVVGLDGLPTFDDRTLLPYIGCVVLEVLRWNVVTPLGFPHMVVEEDEYLGYHIPKGSMVLGNNGAILRVPDVFPNPEKFDPSRFLETAEGSATARETIESTVYGWGKRTCPGRHVGYSALFIMISHILTCFDIVKPLNDAGEEFEPVPEFWNKFFVRRALPTPCRIRIRSDKIMQLLARTE